MSRGWGAWLLWALALGLVAGCDDGEDDSEADAGAASGTLEAALEQFIDETGAASIAVGVIADGALLASAARGMADAAEGRAATVDTIYGLASCSKPVVGLAAALMVDEVAGFDLDADVNDWLEWDEPLAHPSHPEVAVTMRMLLTHTAGIASDGPADYETYPKPDPDQALAPFLQPLLADAEYWVGAPGAGYEYSNLGAALAALVIEEATQVDFRAFCETRIFEPLGMDDTRWFYADLSDEQRSRHAIPYDPDGEAYEIYGYNDYPSGLLRTTVGDYARLMIALAGSGVIDGMQVVPAATVQRFHSVPMLILRDDEGGVVEYSHSGGEAGISTLFSYREDGRGYVYLVNTDVEDDVLEAAEEGLLEALEERAGIE